MKTHYRKSFDYGTYWLVAKTHGRPDSVNIKIEKISNRQEVHLKIKVLNSGEKFSISRFFQIFKLRAAQTEYKMEW